MPQLFADAFFHPLFRAGRGRRRPRRDPATTMRRLLAGHGGRPDRSTRRLRLRRFGFVDHTSRRRCPAGPVGDRFVAVLFPGFTGGLNWCRNLDRNWG
jgi:hypothetical protein